MNREDAIAIINEFISNKNLIRHMLAVESAMRFYANYYHEDEEKWAITGLLHDFDYEIHPTMDKHPQEGAKILRSRGVPEDIVLAILSHGNNTGIPRDTLLRKVLFACDEVTGLIIAVALVRPSKSLLDLSASSVKKKWNNHQFAAGANREEMIEGAQSLNLDLWQHVENAIQAMRSVAPELGLDGK